MKNEDNSNKQTLVATSSKVAPRAREQIVVTNQSVVVKKVSFSLDGVKTNGTVISLSKFGTASASLEEIVAECEKLVSAFPMTNAEQQKSFYSLLYKTIREEGMSLECLKHAIRKVITENKYQTFRIADVVGFDRKINLAKTISALRYISKPQEIDYNDIVILWGNVNGEICRLFGIKDEVENSVYASRIVGVWNDTQHKWDWVGSIDDPTIEQRKLDFRKSLFPFCNKPPYNGKYETELVKKFYERYSQIVPPGDRLLFETITGWDAELYLENFYQQQKLKNNELTSENC